MPNVAQQPGEPHAPRPTHPTSPRISQQLAEKHSRNLARSAQIWTNLDFPGYLKREFPAHNAKPYDLSRISIAQRKTYGEATLLNCFEGIVPKAGAQPGSGCGGWAATHASSIDTPRPGASGTER